MRIKRSTPAVATTVLRYLFQSWVSASEGGDGTVVVYKPGFFCGEWIGILRVRWLEAEGGVRRSKRRRCESEETEERREGEWGENAAEYVQECVGSVSMDVGRVVFHCYSIESTELAKRHRIRRGNIRS